MTKANRLLVAALVVQVAILVIVRVVRTGPESLKKTPVLGQLDTESIKRIKIVDDDKVVELERSGDAWLLASGGGYPVKEDKAKELVSRFPGLLAGKAVATKAEHHRALEVAEDDNQRDITLTLKDGKTLRFFLGSSPGIKKVHLRLDGKDEVVVVAGLSTWDIGAGASNWVETEYFKLDKDKVVALSLKNDDGQIELRKVGGAWQLAGASPKEKLKSSAVDSLVRSVSAVHLNAPVGREVKAEYGLQSPKALLSVVTETQVEQKGAAKPGEEAPVALDSPSSQPSEQVTRKTYVLRIGTKQGNDGYYAKSDSSDFVVRLATWTAETLINKKRADLLEQEKKADDKGQAKKGRDGKASSG